MPVEQSHTGPTRDQVVELAEALLSVLVRSHGALADDLAEQWAAARDKLLQEE